ncbi:MAG: hypothetical protein LBR81_07695 [Prevotellaceae bacterium]|nr:hypothetical protein [Prevotellaceae bacterium]
MKKFFLGLLLSLAILPAFAQKTSIVDNKAIKFELTQNNDSIHFIVVDTVLTQKKPVFLWSQGSRACPLIIRFENGNSLLVGISNFDIASIKKYYHLVIVSMPKTPVVANENELTDFEYISPNPEHRNDFFKADYWENHVERANIVLGFLRKQSWVDNSKLVVAGHSQGARIAPRIAFRNKNVTHLGMFSANPFGRIDQMIQSARKNAESGKISWEKAEKEMEYWYDLYKRANNPQEVEKTPELTPWKSYSEAQIDELVKINIPIYLAYGTADVGSDLCDLVPLHFIREGKDNLTLKRYFNLEHNFFEVDENGVPDRNKRHWVEVMNEFVKWTIEEFK